MECFDTGLQLWWQSLWVVAVRGDIRSALCYATDMLYRAIRLDSWSEQIKAWKAQAGTLELCQWC